MSHDLSCLTNTGFDIQAAVLLARSAELAYVDDATIISNWAIQQGFSNVTAFNQGNIQGFWTTANKVALLAFRGTSNLGQSIRDARLIPAGHSWGRVHKGFYDGLAKVEELLDGFDQSATEVEHVWITGHSLGGALAILAAARLKQQGIISHVYTYGQPRMAFGDFARRFESELPERLWRFINQSDIVARLPPGILYRHCGQVKRIVRPGQLEARGLGGMASLEFSDTDLPPITDEECEALLQKLDSVPEAVGVQGLEGRMALIRDHSILDYIRRLTEIRDK